MEDILREPVELTEIELDEVAGGCGGCDRGCHDDCHGGGFGLAIAVAVAAAVAIKL